MCAKLVVVLSTTSTSSTSDYHLYPPTTHPTIHHVRPRGIRRRRRAHAPESHGVQAHWRYVPEEILATNSKETWRPGRRPGREVVASAEAVTTHHPQPPTPTLRFSWILLTLQKCSPRTSAARRMPRRLLSTAALVRTEARSLVVSGGCGLVSVNATREGRQERGRQTVEQSARRYLPKRGSRYARC